MELSPRAGCPEGMLGPQAAPHSSLGAPPAELGHCGGRAAAGGGDLGAHPPPPRGGKRKEKLHFFRKQGLTMGRVPVSMQLSRPPGPLLVISLLGLNSFRHCGGLADLSFSGW